MKKEIRIAHHNREVFAVVCMPETAGKAPAVIMSHGYGGCYEDFLKDCERLSDKGIIGICFDYCGARPGNRSTGNTWDMTLLTEKEDLIAVLDEVMSWEQTDKEHVYLFGASQGGMISALAAEENRERIAGLCLLYPAFCIADDWIKKYPEYSDMPEREIFWGVELGQCFARDIHDLKIFETIGSYEGPVYIAHGDEDKIVPLSYSREASKLYRNCRLEVFAGEGHGFGPEASEKVCEQLLMMAADCQHCMEWR